MPTSLTLDTARSVDGRLVPAAGEIDLSNVEPFSQRLRRQSPTPTVAARAG
jgi:hypothetical protein